MTQIVTISANTAALNIEALRTPRRIAVKDQVRDIRSDADKNAKRAENVSDPEALDASIPAINVGLDFLSSEQHAPQQLPLRFVEAAYRDLED